MDVKSPIEQFEDLARYVGAMSFTGEFMISGKALIVVERRANFHGHRMFTVVVNVLTGDRFDFDVHEDLYCSAESDPPTTNLKVGEKAWCWVRWELEYHCYEDWYSGGTECDVNVSYPKVKILKRQKPPRPLRKAKALYARFGTPAQLGDSK